MHEFIWIGIYNILFEELLVQTPYICEKFNHQYFINKMDCTMNIDVGWVQKNYVFISHPQLEK